MTVREDISLCDPEIFLRGKVQNCLEKDEECFQVGCPFTMEESGDPEGGRVFEFLSLVPETFVTGKVTPAEGKRISKRTEKLKWGAAYPG